MTIKGYAMASKMLVEKRLPVLYMYREKPDNPSDSGWRFFSGYETQEYADDSSNISIYDIGTITEFDKSIISYLCSAFGTAWERDTGEEEFRPVRIEGKR